MWENEKLRITRYFSFSHSVFKRLVSKGCQKVSLCGNKLKNYKLLSIEFCQMVGAGNKPTLLTLSHTSPGFYLSAEQVFLKTLWEKEKLLVMSNYSFSHSGFYPFGKHPTIFIQFEIVVCKLFLFGSVRIFLFGKALVEMLLLV